MMENCAQLLEEEVNKMFVTKYLNEHDCNIVGINSLNIHDANDMQSHKLGDVICHAAASSARPGCKAHFLS